MTTPRTRRRRVDIRTRNTADVVDCRPVPLDGATPVAPVSTLTLAADAARAAERMRNAIDGRTSYSDTIAIAAALARATEALTARVADAYAERDGLPE